ncbi:phosphoribosylanthranilate isomerase [Rossellomorea aquimaris]|uniref:phosphoribosylanthranilate isomerase n=1 Tax=Rossellomorea aquimaris TaxID=189382 RepID=UPI001CD538F2|nr:phosphoribosylanthranilate isomerase [Rossellomorea aquimaris]MCA1054468.1 phosphoribosylanthranilate isomerase [Rossellomorea aquimaris]
MTKIKVCGIQEREEALWAAEAGVDAIGFVFAESKRRIALEKAAAISASLPNEVLKIGVFVNATKSELLHAAKTAGLDYVQLHGDESPEFCKELTIPFIKAISIKDRDDLEAVTRYGNEMILVDSGKGPFRGGNGTSFDWDYLSGHEATDRRLILAGGLRKNNISEAIRKVKPYMVDVSSGVERNGRKDERLIKEFIEEVKAINKESGE